MINLDKKKRRKIINTQQCWITWNTTHYTHQQLRNYHKETYSNHGQARTAQIDEQKTNRWTEDEQLQQHEKESSMAAGGAAAAGGSASAVALAAATALYSSIGMQRTTAANQIDNRMRHNLGVDMYKTISPS